MILSFLVILMPFSQVETNRWEDVEAFAREVTKAGQPLQLVLKPVRSAGKPRYMVVVIVIIIIIIISSSSSSSISISISIIIIMVIIIIIIMVIIIIIIIVILLLVLLHFVFLLLLLVIIIIILVIIIITTHTVVAGTENVSFVESLSEARKAFDAILGHRNLFGEINDHVLVQVGRRLVSLTAVGAGLLYAEPGHLRA
jgi:fatty acid desaturase